MHVERRVLGLRGEIIAVCVLPHEAHFLSVLHFVMHALHAVREEIGSLFAQHEFKHIENGADLVFADVAVDTCAAPESGIAARSVRPRFALRRGDDRDRGFRFFPGQFVRRAELFDVRIVIEIIHHDAGQPRTEISDFGRIRHRGIVRIHNAFPVKPVEEGDRLLVFLRDPAGVDARLRIANPAPVSAARRLENPVVVPHQVAAAGIAERIVFSVSVRIVNRERLCQAVKFGQRFGQHEAMRLVEFVRHLALGGNHALADQNGAEFGVQIFHPVVADVHDVRLFDRDGKKIIFVIEIIHPVQEPVVFVQAGIDIGIRLFRHVFPPIQHGAVPDHLLKDDGSVNRIVDEYVRQIGRVVEIVDRRLPVRIAAGDGFQIQSAVRLLQRLVDGRVLPPRGVERGEIPLENADLRFGRAAVAGGRGRPQQTQKDA